MAPARELRSAIRAGLGTRSFVAALGRFSAALAIGMGLLHPANAQTYAERPEVRAFVAEMVKRHGFKQRYLDRLFAEAHFEPAVLTLMTPLPADTRSWLAYRATFVNPPRIDAGLEFWRRHAKSLARAAAAYGVPPEIVVAIIGVETRYGRNVGGFRVLDALATLAFDYPPRAEFFRAELEEFLLYVRESRLEATNLRGSYAGAIGIPQFMPGSIRRYGVDFDRDGRRDLQASVTDAIGSVANFLHQHGWKARAPVAVAAQVQGERYRLLVGGGVEPLYRAQELREVGVEFDESVGADAPSVLIELESPDGPPEYFVGFENFYVLTRYNRSSFYATAVFQLSEALKAAYRDRSQKPHQ